MQYPTMDTAFIVYFWTILHKMLIPKSENQTNNDYDLHLNKHKLNVKLAMTL